MVKCYTCNGLLFIGIYFTEYSLQEEQFLKCVIVLVKKRTRCDKEHVEIEAGGGTRKFDMQLAYVVQGVPYY